MPRNSKLLLALALAFLNFGVVAQTISPVGGGSPSGVAGGGLAGTYPNPTVFAVPASAMPALTGDCTTSAGAVSTNCTKTGGVAFGPAAIALVGQIPGTTTNDNACSGCVGEFKTSTAAATAVSLSPATATNCVTLPLTSGDWMVAGDTSYAGAASTTVAYSRSSVSANSLTEGASTNTFYGANVTYFSSVNGAGFTSVAPPVRISLLTGANVFMEGYMNFGVSTATCGGTINAWRTR